LRSRRAQAPALAPKSPWHLTLIRIRT